MKHFSLNFELFFFKITFELNSCKLQGGKSRLPFYSVLFFLGFVLYCGVILLCSSSKAFMVSHPPSPMKQCSTICVYPVKVVKFLNGPTTFLQFKCKQERLVQTPDM